MRIKSLYYYYYSPNGLCSNVHNFLGLHKTPLINIWQLVTILKLSLPVRVAPLETDSAQWRRPRELSVTLWRTLQPLAAPNLWHVHDEWSRFTTRHYKKQANRFIIFRKAGFNSPISFTIPTFVSFNSLCLSYLLWGVWVPFLGSSGLFLPTATLRVQLR